MSGIYSYINKLCGVKHVEIHIVCEYIRCRAECRIYRYLERLCTYGSGCEYIGRLVLGHCRNCNGILNCIENRKVTLTYTQTVNDTVDSHIRCLIVVNLCCNCGRLALDLDYRVLCYGAYSDLAYFACPNRCGNCDISVCLIYSNVVVRVITGQCYIEYAGIGIKLLGIYSYAAVYNNRYQTYHVRGIRIAYRCINVYVVRRIDNRTHGHVIQSVHYLKVMVLCRIDSSVTHSLVDAFFCEVICKYYCTCRIRVTPLALVVILIVCRRYVPTFVECECIVLVAGPV